MKIKLFLLNQAHDKDIIFGTEDAAGSAKTPLTLKGHGGQAVFGGHVTASGDISGSGTISGDMYITDTQTVAAAGSNQGDAAAIAATAGTVFVSTDADTKGVRLPAVNGLASGSVYTLYNTSGEQMKVYPASSDRIFPLSDNANATLPDNASMTVTSFSTDGWQGFIGTVIS